ncbi:MAG: bifunctional oligoribonuclease/PAP phosphatase NrnA [Phycisphaerales bacterium]|nr:bifunctional oligoribonuclease/PAP phosphatase NrnA [Phycisphaerales bacterium]
MTSKYESNVELHTIADRISRAGRIAITTHVKPDGDAIGSTIALARAVERLGKRAEVWYSGPVMDVFKRLIAPTAISVVAESVQPGDEIDLILVTDTGARSQLNELGGWLERHREKICIIDHHIQGDADLSDCRFVRADACAASEIAIDLIDALGVEVDRAIAEPLYLGIATDTGWFRFSNTTAATFRHAARLVQAGIDHAALFRAIEQTDPPSRLRLLARALTSLEIVAAGRVAVLTLRKADYEAAGATPDDSHGFSDLPLSVESVEVACVIAETNGGSVKLSLRSKPGPDAIDVNQVARQFGGGGHARASGAKMDGPMDAARLRVVAALDRL